MAKHAAGVLVFLVSAVFHELLVGLPLHMLRAWSFIGIMSQVSRRLSLLLNHAAGQLMLQRGRLYVLHFRRQLLWQSNASILP